MSCRETTRAARRRELVLSTIPEDGASVAQVAAALGILVISAEQRLRLYAKAGHLFSARVAREPGKRAESWYFHSQGKRDEVQAACTKKTPKAPAGMPKWARREAAAPAPEAAPVNRNNVRPVVLPSNLRDRFSVDITCGGFSSLPPGVYALPASSCAARAVSEAA